METGLPWNDLADTSPDREAHSSQKVEGLWERGRSRVRHASGDPFSVLPLGSGESHCQGQRHEVDGHWVGDRTHLPGGGLRRGP